MKLSTEVGVAKGCTEAHCYLRLATEVSVTKGYEFILDIGRMPRQNLQLW